MPTLLKEVETYWTLRSDGYCRVNEKELACFQQQAWIDLIRGYAPWGEGERLRVLDAGTGPGFLALCMAGCGHHVTGVDYTEAMLGKARMNARRYGRSVRFIRMDVQDLEGFEDGSFDLVLTRNLTWNLEAPEKAYEEFHRVLAPGGRLLNFDANWYLHLHDPVERRAYEQDRQKVLAQNASDHYTCTDTEAMERIAAALPLSRIRRPEWDIRILRRLGFAAVKSEEDVGTRVWDREERLNYGATPLFAILAEKRNAGTPQEKSYPRSPWRD